MRRSQFSNNYTLFGINIVPSVSKFHDFAAKASDLQRCQTLHPRCFCFCLHMCVSLSEKRVGPTSLAGWSVMVDEWHSRCLSIFSSKHPRQAGRRGSWEHEEVQRWTVDFQFIWLNWKVKPVWSWQCQSQLWRFVASYGLRFSFYLQVKL